MNEYLHIKVNSLSDKNQVVALSTDDQKCLNNRKLLGMQAKGPINLFLPKEQIPSNNAVYVCIKCQGEKECRHQITLSDDNYCKLDLGEQYSYYVDDSNTKKMTFEFNKKNNVNLRNLATVKTLANIWVKGENVISSTLKVGNREIDNKKFSHGYIFQTEFDANDEYKLDVNSEIGDYVTVGSLLIDDGETEEIKTNNLEIMGMVDNDFPEMCFPFNKEGEKYKARVSGVVYTKKASYYFKNENNIGQEKETKNGVINEPINVNEAMSFCVKHFLYTKKTTPTIFSIQITSNEIEKNNYSKFIYSPQLSGIIYGHILFYNEFAIFQGRRPKDGSLEINYNMKALKGFPDMFFAQTCTTFPDCEYIDEDFQSLVDPGHSNRMTLYNYYLDSETNNFSPVSSNQPLLLVYCLDSSSIDKDDFGYCEFETSIFSDLDPLNLVEGKSYSQYILENQHDLYTIDIEYEEDLDKIYLDLIVFSGDVFFELDSSIVANKYYLSNKIFYSIHVKEFKSDIKKIDFRVHGEKNSFYLIQYQFVRDTPDSGNRNLLESGINYVESIYIGEGADFYKYVDLLNFKNGPYLASFYSQNCKFMVTRYLQDGQNQYIALHENYGQVIIDKDDADYGQSKFSFKIDITGDDSSEYNKKLCMLYISGLELSNENTGFERSISVSEGVPQYYIFTEKYPVMKYTYHVSNINNTVVIKFNLIDKAPYNVTINYGKGGYYATQIHRNDQIYLFSKDLEKACQHNKEVCNVNINIELVNKGRERRLETTIYQINGSPIYLEKNVVKQDILLGNIPKFYYMDIGKDEISDITIDYKRGSGYIYATIVKKDLNESCEQKGMDWRGKYVFPKSKEGTLPYDTYLKKIYILQEYTKDCDNGCYVLITVENTVEREIKDDDERENLIPYRITLTPRVFSKFAAEVESELLMPKVKILVNEFVIGDVTISKDMIYNYYEVTLPFESDYVFFDWQSDSINLFINVGEERPTINEAHFKLYSVDHDTVFNITKEDILEVAEKNNIQLPEQYSIRNVVLTLGLWANKIDTIFSSVFAFKIFMPPIYKEYGIEFGSFEILHVRSDQKVQCRPFLMEDNYTCLFAVIFDGSDANSSLVVYPRAHNESAKLVFTGEMIDSEEVERNNLEYILNKMNNMKAQYSTNNGAKYIFEKTINTSKCLLFMVSSEYDTIIEILSSTYTYRENQVFVPNPSTAQIFALGSSKIMINFETSKDLLINIVGINGGGYFNWDTDKEKNINYYIYGFEDRLTLTSGTEIADNRLSCLVAQSTTFSWFEDDKSGFVFYVTFYPRTIDHNMDQVKAGRSVEINYREVKFPLNFYTRLTDKDLAISFTFYNYYMNVYDRLVYDKPMLKIWGRVITEQQALDARYDVNMKPNRDEDNNTVYGVFDGAFATLFLNSNDIQKFGIKESENPTLFFSAEMEEGISYDFNGVGVEVTVLREESKTEAKLFAPEHVYLNGKLLTSNPRYTYKLRSDDQNPYMQVEFSSNNWFINFCIGIDKNCQMHSKELEEFEDCYLNGRNILTFKVPKFILDTNNTLYLVVFYFEDVHKLDAKLANYVFKYMNGKQKNSFFTFPQEKNLIEYEMIKDGDGTSYIFSFYPVDYSAVSYYIKGVYRHDKIDEEVKDTIAISESEGTYLQVDNPRVNEDGKVKLIFENVKKDIAYIKILAKVDFEATKEYLLYSPIDIYGDDVITDVDEVNLKQSISVQDINISTEKRKLIGKANNVNTVQNYRIIYDKKNKIPNYIKVETVSKGNKNQIIYFSPTNEDCKTNRKQIGQSGRSEKAHLWIKKEQLENRDTFYISVQCQEGRTCSYDIEFTGYEFPQIRSAIFVHNYYVSKENQVMSFRINNTLDLSETSDQVLTLYATGGKKISLSLSHCIGGCKQYNFKTGAAITTKIPKHLYFELKVTAEEGDYISIGSKITGSDGKSLENTLNPNEYQFTGYLRKDLLEKECYTLPNVRYSDSFYLSAVFYNSIAEIYFKDADFKDIKRDYETVTRGFYSYVHNSENDNRKYLCIGIPRSTEYTIYDLPYSLQMTDPTKNVGLFNIYAPQLRGVIYPRIIPKGGVVFFNAANLNSDTKPVIYNVLSTIGYSKMYMYKCTSYPFCQFDYNSLDDKENIIKLNEINRVTNWINENEGRNNSPIEAEQYVMVVKCEDLNDLTINYCQILTSIYGSEDIVSLVEGHPFARYIKQNKKEQYLIDYTKDKKVKKIHLDTLVVSGDVDFKINYESGASVKCHKYYLANKMLYSIPTDDQYFTEEKKIIVTIEAKKDSYYSIDFKYIKNERDEANNEVYEGINNLVAIPSIIGKNQKFIEIHNGKLLSTSKYLINFYSLNCKLDIERVVESEENVLLKSYGKYGQDIISSKLIDETVHMYQVSVREMDTSKYTNNMCMLYVNALQITKDPSSKAQKQILIADGVPQKMIFQNDVKRVRYIYPNADPSKNIAINFKVITAGNYTLSAIYNHNLGYSRSYSKSDTIYLDNSVNTDNCKENELCNIILGIDLSNEYNNVIPMIEVTFRQINNIPYYVPKEVVQQDFLPAKSWLYLFTTLGKDDEGYITMNIARGSGYIYAKIVPFEKETVTRELEDTSTDFVWRNHIFPKVPQNSLYYDFYNKKMTFTNKNTNNCGNGCYLLIAIEPSVKGQLDEEYRFYQFSISISLSPSGTLKQIGPVIEITLEEYVIGSLDIQEKIKNKDMYEFYKVNIPFDAEIVEFDWQSDAAILLVNIGEKRPTVDNYHYKFDTSRSDTVFKLDKTEIKKYLTGDMTNSYITIGVYTEDLDSIYGTVYSFRVHFIQELNIYKINSDQKTVCQPQRLNDNEYRCLFMIIYSDLDFINDLMIYAKSQSPTAVNYMYGKYISDDIYDSYNIDLLRANIPDDNDDSNYNTKKDKTNFIFLTSGKIKSHFYVSVISNEPNFIEFFTSMKTFDKELSPNPSTIQLFAIHNEKNLTLKFVTQRGLFINIVSLYGSSKLILENEPNDSYNLRGRDDQLSLAIPYYEGSTPTLLIENLNYKEQSEDDYYTEDENEKPGFAFYIEYYLRSFKTNFDEINLGKTTEVAYKRTDFPLYYYSKLTKVEYSINVFFNLHDLEYTTEGGSNIAEAFSIKGSLIEQKTAYRIKNEEEDAKPNLDDTPIVGIYDPALKAGQVYFSYNNLKDLGNSIKDKPTLYVSIEKSNDVKFNKFRMELTAFQENSYIPVTEKLYQYGKIYDKDIINFYKLKVDNSVEGYMRIQFATNNANIRFAINNEPNKKEKIKYDEYEEKTIRGKTFITFKKPKDKDFIYLNVYLEKPGDFDTKTNHYTFKYINSEKKDLFFEYKIENDPNISVTSGNKDITIKFNKIIPPNSSSAQITYYIKVIKPENYIQNEIIDTISLTESKAEVTPVTNINTPIKIPKVDYKYIQVIGYIKDGPINEYVSYSAYKAPDNQGGGSKTLIIVIGITAALFVVVIVLIIIVVLFNAKNKDLMDKVNKISFVSSESKPSGESNLLMGENELQ